MKKDVIEALKLEQDRHPQAQAQDMVKLLVQSCLGVAHLHIEQPHSLAMLEKQRSQQLCDDRLLQDIGNGLCRVPLSFMEIAHLPLWNQLFLATCKYGKQDTQQFEHALLKLRETYEISDEVCAQAKQGVHHSEVYRNAYQPSYRVIKYDYVRYFPVLCNIWQHRQDHAITRIGIDGRCASGKSTVSMLIQEVFSIPLFHMDHYFLPVSLRTQARLAQIGGNVDFDRFVKEVIEPLRKQQNMIDRRYDCQTNTFLDIGEVAYQSCVIWEGSYAHHPQFQRDLTARIFLTCREDIQKARLRKRSPRQYERFIKEWIPMEEAYFKTYHIQEQSDLVIDTSDF